MPSAFDMAARLAAMAREEFAAATDKGKFDSIAIRQAAEKGWLAVVEATKALLEAEGMRPPGGTAAQRDALLRLERQTRKARGLRSAFSAARDELHVSCFYDGECSVPVLEDRLAAVVEYVENTREVVTTRH